MLSLSGVRSRSFQRLCECCSRHETLRTAYLQGTFRWHSNKYDAISSRGICKPRWSKVKDLENVELELWGSSCYRLENIPILALNWSLLRVFNYLKSCCIIICAIKIRSSFRRSLGTLCRDATSWFSISISCRREEEFSGFTLNNRLWSGWAEKRGGWDFHWVGGFRGHPGGQTAG